MEVVSVHLLTQVIVIEQSIVGSQGLRSLLTISSGYFKDLQ